MTIELNPKQGRFHSVEEALGHAIQSIASEEISREGSKRPAGKKSLVEVFAELRGLELDFSRNPSAGRPVEL